MERKNSVVCGAACWGTKYKEKYRQLTSKAIYINFASDALIWSFVMVTIPCLDVSDSEVIHLDRDLAIGIQCGPHYKTKEVLNQG